MILLAHTFRITGARLLASWGLDAYTIGIHGRWSSSAIISCLAESPLISVATRLRNESAVSRSIRDLAERIAALEEFFISDSEQCSSSSDSSSS